ncbi:MAG: biopolymer transporter ExbD [Kiritimatiellia bacterium]|nr:biopolymer transporter ExbD [Kiritimatiellia bacterium]
MNFRSKLRNDAAGFQLAPMIDVVFLLLCFFVTSQIFAQWEMEIDIKLPTASTGKVPQRLPGEIILNLDSEGRVVVNNRHLEAGDLDSLLSRLVRLFPGQPVVLRADRATAYEHVVRVLDACRRADIWNISFATAVPSDSP